MSAQPIDEQRAADPQPFTVDMVRQLPDTGYRYEIVDGSLIVTPPAGGFHMDLSARLFTWLNGELAPDWRVRYELGISAAGASFVPDLVVLHPDTPVTGDLYLPGHFAVLVVEIASASTDELDRTVKFRRYARQGIPMYWQVERASDGITINVHTGPGYDGYQHTETVRAGGTLEIKEPFALTVDPARV